jgi:hypothetical protein
MDRKQDQVLFPFDVLILLIQALVLLGHLHPMRRYVNQCRFGVRISHLTCKGDVLLCFSPVCFGIH